MAKSKQRTQLNVSVKWGRSVFAPFPSPATEIKKGKIMKKEAHINFKRTKLSDGLSFRQATKRMLIVLPKVITEGTLHNGQSATQYSISFSGGGGEIQG